MSNSAPFSYDYQNAVLSKWSPSEVHLSDNVTASFFRKYLLMQAISRFEFTLPDWWDKDYFSLGLFEWGFLTVFDSKRFGVIPQGCSLSGYNVFYRPTNALVVNPSIGTKDLRIGKDCEIIKLQNNYSGIMDIVSFYADMMALTAETAGTNILNSKLAYVFACKNKATAETFKKLFDQIMSGKPAAFVDKDLFDETGKLAVQMFNQNLQQTYIADKLMADLRGWELEFCKKVGIPNTGEEKSQYVSEQALYQNSSGTTSLCKLWLENLESCFDKVNRMFPEVNLSVKLRELEPAPAQEVDDEPAE